MSAEEAVLEATESARQVEELPDTELASAAAAGEGPAFEELYKRNVPAAWRIAHAVAGNRDDASDAVADAFERVFRAVTTGRLSESAAFRPYLLTATRRAAIDISKRSGRTEPTDELEDLDTWATGAEPQDRIVADTEARLLVEAFRDLPERWRSVLWLVEVEELSSEEAAEVLGVSPNNAAQLAVRARIGLRKRYLAAHLREGTRPECKQVIERLGAYVEGALGQRRAARVDGHLTTCRACRDRRQELEEVGITLRRSVLPVPVGIGALAAAGWRTLATSSAGGPRAWIDSVRHLPARLPRVDPAVGWLSNVTPDLSASASAVERLVSWATAGVFVLGVSVGVVRAGSGPSQGAAPSPASPAVAESESGGTAVVISDAASAGTGVPVSGSSVSAMPEFAGAPGGSAATAGLAPRTDTGLAGARSTPRARIPADVVGSVVAPVKPVADVLAGPGVVNSVVSSVTGAGGGLTPALPVPPIDDIASTVVPGGEDGLPPVTTPPVLGAPLELPVPPLSVPNPLGEEPGPPTTP